MVRERDDFPILRRDAGPGELTVLHLLNVPDETDFDHRALEWGRAVWETWRKHHTVIAAAVRELGF
jgi:hypothetical protein